MKNQVPYCYEPPASRRAGHVGENILAACLLVIGGVALLFLLFCIHAQIAS